MDEELVDYSFDLLELESIWTEPQNQPPGMALPGSTSSSVHQVIPSRSPLVETIDISSLLRIETLFSTNVNLLQGFHSKWFTETQGWGDNQIQLEISVPSPSSLQFLNAFLNLRMVEEREERISYGDSSTREQVHYVGQNLVFFRLG